MKIDGEWLVTENPAGDIVRISSIVCIDSRSGGTRLTLIDHSECTMKEKPQRVFALIKEQNYKGVK